MSPSSTTRRRGLVLCGLVFVFGACSSDDGSADHKRESAAAVAKSCHENCDAQAAVTGCMQSIDPELCNTLCDATVRVQPAECAEPFRTYYECTVSLGFECSESYVAQKKTGDCDDLSRDLRDCQLGGASCAGADPAGFCPSVECPCPSGTTSISGFSRESGSCVCFDATTCLDSC